MIDDQQRARDLRRTLVANGFKRDRSDTSNYRYTGKLSAAGRKVSVAVTFSDLEFTTLPLVTLLDPAREAPNVVAHLMASEALCFANNDDVVLDRYDVGGTALTCLELARRGLERALTHKRIEKEVAEEFPQHWFGVPFYYDIQTKKDARARLYNAPRQKRSDCLLLTDNSEALKRLVDAGVPQKNAQESARPAYLFQSERDLTFTSELRAPECLLEFLLWLEAMIPGARDRALAELAATFPKAPPAIFANAPNGCVGIVVRIPSTLMKAAQRRQGFERILRTNSSKVALERYSGRRVDLDFIFKRNMKRHPPLVGRRIAVIGCGTIGGHLAKLLVHSGAGHGDGSLLLLDNQRLEPGNIGRHVLGSIKIGEYKADGLKHELQHQFPDAHVRAIHSDAASSLAMLADYDLVIDATGEEALSNTINHYFVSLRSTEKAPDVLHISLYGNGLAAQALLVDGNQYACLKCLKPDHRGDERYSPLKPGIAAVHSAAACGEAQYVAYGIAAPVMAAALVIQLTLDWNAGNPGPRMRTIRVEKKDTREITDKNPERSERCPACAKIPR